MLTSQVLIQTQVTKLYNNLYLCVRLSHMQGCTGIQHIPNPIHVTRGLLNMIEPTCSNAHPQQCQCWFFFSFLKKIPMGDSVGNVIGNFVFLRKPQLCRRIPLSQINSFALSFTPLSHAQTVLKRFLLWFFDTEVDLEVDYGSWSACLFPVLRQQLLRCCKLMSVQIGGCSRGFGVSLSLKSHLLLVSSQTGIVWNFGSRKLTEYEFIEGLLHHVPRSDDQSITS